MDLEKTTYNIDNSGSAAGVPAGLRLAVAADLHNSDPSAALKIMHNDVPDIIMIPGDLVLGYVPGEFEYIIDRCGNIMPFLKECVKIAPTYMSLGNHECALCDEELERLKETGITLLDNEWTEHRPGHSGDPAAGRILIGGLTSAFAMSYRSFRKNYNRDKSEDEYVRYPFRGRNREVKIYPADSSWLDDFEKQDGFKILLCHHPEYWALREPMIKNRKFDLVISGHAHGGQWRIFGRGIYAPGQGLLPKYTGGMHRGPHGSLIISRGLSNPYGSVPRFGNPCEMVYVQLPAKESPAGI